jgi:hypothetical protein
MLMSAGDIFLSNNTRSIIKESMQFLGVGRCKSLVGRHCAGGVANN